MSTSSLSARFRRRPHMLRKREARSAPIRTSFVTPYRTLATSSGHSLQGDVSFDYLTADLDWLRRAQDDISGYILRAAGKDTTFKFDQDSFSGVSSGRS